MYSAGLAERQGSGKPSCPRSDDGAVRVAAGALFPGGLKVFGTLYSGDDIWIGTNGVVSFGAGYEGIPSSTGMDPELDILAPFWADVDTREVGEGSESGPIWIDIQGGTLTVTWQDVGRYRHDNDPTNLFQVQITDRGGGDFDLRFAYERIDWTHSTQEEELGARMILSSPRLPEPWIEAGDPMTLDTRTGNTGAEGSWLFQMRDGALPGLTPVTGLAETGGSGGRHAVGRRGGGYPARRRRAGCAARFRAGRLAVRGRRGGYAERGERRRPCHRRGDGGGSAGRDLWRRGG